MTESIAELLVAVCIMVLLILFLGEPDLMDHLTGDADRIWELQEKIILWSLQEKCNEGG